jgi:dynein heavy chain
MRKATNEEEQDTIFVDFIEENSGRNIYVEVAYKDRKDLKNFIEEKLNDYN